MCGKSADNLRFSHPFEIRMRVEGGATIPTYRVPLVWQLYGHVHVTAETKEAAIEYALGPECPLPPGDYVTDSVAVDEDIEVEEE